MIGIPSYDAAFWRSFARWGSTKLPRWFLRLSPGPIGLGVGGAQARMRKMVRDNLRLVHGQRSTVIEALDIASTFASFGHCLAEGLAASGDKPPPFRYTMEGRDIMLGVRDAGRGGILVTAHIGSWDVTGSVMNLRGFDLAIAMAPERDAGARAISDAGRARVGVKVFHVGDDPLAALPLAQHVRKGGAVALQIDRVPPGMRSRRTTFFGRPWDAPLGPFQLAQVTQAPIVPVFTARLGFAHHLVHVDPPILLPKRPTQAELDRAIGAAMASMERFIRRFPMQWFHFAPHPPLEVFEDYVDRARSA